MSTSLQRTFPTLLRGNAHLLIALSLFVAGFLLIRTEFKVVAGALFGAGASLLGSWLSEYNRKCSDVILKEERACQAKNYFTPELVRTIQQVIRINQRSLVNWEMHLKKVINPNNKLYATGDNKTDFHPYLPILYPNFEHLKDLPPDKLRSLVHFYDSLYRLDLFVRDWWKREGQLDANIFNMILSLSEASLVYALDCIDKFGIDDDITSPYQIDHSLKNSINTTRENIQNSRDRLIP